MCVCVCVCVCLVPLWFKYLTGNPMVPGSSPISCTTVPPRCNRYILFWGASSPGSFSPTSSGPGGTSGAHTTLAERLRQASCKFLIPANPSGVYPTKHILTCRPAYWLHTPRFGSASLPLQPSPLRSFSVPAYTIIHM